MRKVIRKRIRRSEGGVNIAADVNIVLSTGENDARNPVVSSHERVEQRSEQDVEPEQATEKEQDR